MSTGGKADAPSVAIVWRGDTNEPAPPPAETRFKRIFEGFALAGARVEPVLFSEEAAPSVRERLLQMDAVLVWVDPIVAGRERTQLDDLLREVSGRGVFVSAHPDVIQVMGTKEVLHRTRRMAWGSETHVYRRPAELLAGLAGLLDAGPQVVKQDRGSSGNGVWRLELIARGDPFETSTVRVQGAQRGAVAEDMAFGDFVEERTPYFTSFNGTGCFVVQPYAARLADGMVRCYMVHDRVAGFGHQFVTALLPAKPGEAAPDPPPREYFGPEKPEFEALRTALESGWIAEMQTLLDIDSTCLPVIWDADFLLGPRDAAGRDSYVLCEINVSGVFPIPDESIEPLVTATLDRVMQHRLNGPARGEAIHRLNR